MNEQATAGRGHWWRRWGNRTVKLWVVVVAVGGGILTITGVVTVANKAFFGPPSCDRSFITNTEPNAPGWKNPYASEVHATGLDCPAAKIAVDQFEASPSYFVNPSNDPAKSVRYSEVSRPFLLAPGMENGKIALRCTYTPHGLGGTEHTVICEDGDVALQWSRFQR